MCDDLLPDNYDLGYNAGREGTLGEIASLRAENERLKAREQDAYFDEFKRGENSQIDWCTAKDAYEVWLESAKGEGLYVIRSAEFIEWKRKITYMSGYIDAYNRAALEHGETGINAEELRAKAEEQFNKWLEGRTNG